VNRGLTVIIIYVGRYTSVGIATRYGLDGPEIKSRWEVPGTVEVHESVEINFHSPSGPSWPVLG